MIELKFLLPLKSMDVTEAMRRPGDTQVSCSLEKQCLQRVRCANTHVVQMRAEGELLNDTSFADLVFYVISYTIESDSDGLDVSLWSTPVILAFGINSVCDS